MQASPTAKGGQRREPVRENVSSMRIQDLAMAEEHPTYSVMLPGNTPEQQTRHPEKLPEHPVRPE